jgi:Mrp family chromosome partitioning ATPase
VKLEVLSAADGAAWEGRLLTAFEAGQLPLAIVRRCVDVVDLLAVAGSGQGQVALVAAGLRRLDSATVDMLSAAGVVAVGVAPRADALAEDRLRQAGIGYLVADDAEPAVVAAVLAEAVRAAAPEGGRHVDSALDAVGGAPRASSAVVTVVADSSGSGSVLAVWGPTGAPGRTTVAVGLADELAGLGCSVLLVDADVYGGTIAPLLGVIDESPGIAAACRQAAAGRLDVETLSALCWQLTPRLRVLTGIPFASRWPELRPTAIPALFETARALADVTVVDCGFCLETAVRSTPRFGWGVARPFVPEGPSQLLDAARAGECGARSLNGDTCGGLPRVAA